MRALTFTASLFLAVALGACGSHRQFRLDPRDSEAAAVQRTVEQFLRAAGDEQVQELPEQIDLRGRMALLQLGQELVLERGMEGSGRAPLWAAALLMGGRDPSSPFTSEELKASSSAVLRKEVAERVGIDEAEEALLGLFLGKPGEVDEAVLKEELTSRLSAADVSGCKVSGPRVGYSAEILDHVRGPGTDAYNTWKTRIRSAHLVTVQCEEKTGLVVVTRYKDSAAPRVAVWQFFTEEEWEVFRPKLDEIFKE